MPNAPVSALAKLRDSQWTKKSSIADEALELQKTPDTASRHVEKSVPKVLEPVSVEVNRAEHQHGPIIRPHEVYVSIERGESIVVGGIFDLVVLDGTVHLYGAVLQASEQSYRVYAPLTHSIAPITAINKTGKLLLSSVDHDATFPPKLHGQGVWEMPRVSDDDSSASMTMLQAGDIKSAQMNWDVHDTASYNGTLNVIVSSNKRPARVLVNSGERHGRSTFAVCLINHLVTRTSGIASEERPAGICVLDLDYHHPLLRPQQHVYAAIIRKPLFGPSLVQMIGKGRETSYEVLRQQFVTQLAVQESPQYFAEVADDLINSIQEHDLSLPLVVIVPAHKILNEELYATLLSIGITDIVQVDKSGLAAAFSKHRARIHLLSSIPEMTSLSSSARRALQLQSRLQFLGHDSENNAHWCPRPLVYQHEGNISMPYGNLNEGVSGICTMNGESLSVHGHDFVLLHSVVSIVSVEKKHFTSIVDSGDEVKIVRSEEGFPILSTTNTAQFPFQARYSNCLGLAYISGISVSERVFYVIPEHDMELGSTEEVKIVFIVGSNDERWIWDEAGI